MFRTIAVAGLGVLLMAGAPALAQEIPGEDVPGLEGGPPPLRAPAPEPKPAVKPKPAPSKPLQSKADTLKSDQTRLAQQREALADERDRLEAQAEDLRARQAGLDERSSDVVARERALADREAKLAAQQAELDRQSAELAQQAAKMTAAENDRRSEIPSAGRAYREAGLDRQAAILACSRAGEDEAHDRNFEWAEYEDAPRFYHGRTWEVRGLMRLEDRRGYMIVDTVCEVSTDGEAQRFTFLR